MIRICATPFTQTWDLRLQDERSAAESGAVSDMKKNISNSWNNIQTMTDNGGHSTDLNAALCSRFLLDSCLQITMSCKYAWNLKLFEASFSTLVHESTLSIVSTSLTLRQTSGDMRHWSAPPCEWINVFIINTPFICGCHYQRLVFNLMRLLLDVWMRHLCFDINLSLRYLFITPNKFCQLTSARQ